MKSVCVIVRDGWGYSEKLEGNAVSGANTPNTDALKEKYPWTLLSAHGESVGLPGGYQGSSEVGHLNMGAGRVVIQELKRIDDELRTGSLFEHARWQNLVEQWKKNNSSLHLLGLLQDEGVHAHQDHLFGIIRRAREEFPEGKIIIHPFLDGRDTPPRSCLEYLEKLNSVMNEVGGCIIGTVMGRYYAMDRSESWDLTDIAYKCLVSCEGREEDAPESAINRSYEEDKTPDGVEMFDEYIPPCVIDGYSGIVDGDCVLHTNYRQDRAIQLSMAFCEDEYPGNRGERPDINYLGLTCYYDNFDEYLIAPMSEGTAMSALLGEIISDAGLKQLRISETQKYRHVTSFFNGKSTTPYEGEEDVEIEGRFDPASFASHPEMEAYNITTELKKRLNESSYSFVLVNYANGDMVGHTGDYEAAKKAIEVVDECVGQAVEALLEHDFDVLITADHGNAEQMVEYETGMPKTSHTTSPVELIWVTKDTAGKQLVSDGKLSDIAPTVLRLLGLEVPSAMLSSVLVCDGS